MTSKKNKPESYNNNPSVLNISNEDFKIRLKKRIELGEEFINRNIANNLELEKIQNEFNIWNDYNYELLKQVFNSNENEYANSYLNSGYSFLGQLGEVQNNPILTLKNLLQYKINNLKSLIVKSELIKSEFTINPKNNSESLTTISKNHVFIVHGHDELAKTQTARFLEQLELNPIILHEQTSAGKTIIEKIEEYSNVGFGIVLYTPCDIGGKKDTTDLKNRARQNVVFEHGFLIGKIGRKNVCALVKGDVEVPNDISGIVYIRMDDDQSWHLKIARELRNSGYVIDLNKL
jgi:predicted nucleotide-binding protein